MYCKHWNIRSIFLWFLKLRLGWKFSLDLAKRVYSVYAIHWYKYHLNFDVWATFKTSAHIFWLWHIFYKMGFKRPCTIIIIILQYSMVDHSCIPILNSTNKATKSVGCTEMVTIIIISTQSWNKSFNTVHVVRTHLLFALLQFFCIKVNFSLKKTVRAP